MNQGLETDSGRDTDQKSGISAFHIPPAPSPTPIAPDNKEVDRGPGHRHAVTHHTEIDIVPGHTPEPAIELPGFEILGELGRGGMGVVYKARQTHLKRLVALKVIIGEGKPTDTSNARFLLEAEAAARLEHPNIIQVYEVGEAGGRAYLALEFVEGPNMASLLDRKPWSPQEAAKWILVLADAMDHAHQRGIVHRDLKPANVLLSPILDEADGDKTARSSRSSKRGLSVSKSTIKQGSIRQLAHWVPKITDFGLAKDLNAQSRTKTGEILGTPSYMAPEQAEGKREIGPATDVYALGAILYELLTGQPPFQGETAWDTIILLASTDATPPRQIRPEIPPALETICLQAIAKVPSQRFASARALAEDLERFLAGNKVQARREGWLQRAVRRARRRPLVPMLLLVAALVLGFGGYAFWSGEQQRQTEAVKTLGEAQTRFSKGDFAEVKGALTAALEKARQEHLTGAVPQEMESLLHRAARGLAVVELHKLADELRFWADPAALSPNQRAALANSCGKVWAQRTALADASLGPLPDNLETQVREDLLDVALLWAELTDTPTEAPIQALKDAEAMLGASPVLSWERKKLCEPGTVVPPPTEAVKTAWEFHALGRALMHAGRYVDAAGKFQQSIDLQPQSFWPMFYSGICLCQTGDPTEALSRLSVCVSKSPSSPECFYNRAIVYERLGKDAQAIEDYEKALKLRPKMAVAALNRGLVFLKQGNHLKAEADLLTALNAGAPRATVYYNLAVLHNDQHDRPKTLDYLNRALTEDPKHSQALTLLTKLAEKPKASH